MQHGAAAGLLARMPIFLGLGRELLDAFMQCGELRHFEAGEVLAETGEPADSGLFMLEGRAALHGADRRPIERALEPGMALNPMAMFVETTHLYGAIATTASAAFVMPRLAAITLLHVMPYMADHFARNIRQDLAGTARTLRELDAMLSRPVDGLEPVVDFAPLNGSGGAAGETGAADGDVSVPGVTNLSVPDRAPVQDLLASLSELNGFADRTRPAPERDPKALPSHAPRRSREARPQPFSEPASPRYDRAAGLG